MTMQKLAKASVSVLALAACACAGSSAGDVLSPSSAALTAGANDLQAAAAARQSNPNRPAPWWADVSKKPDSFYRSDEGLRMAQNILSWQSELGGWPLMNTTREPNTGDPAQAGPWGTKAALIKATVNEMRFLARGFRATEDERYKTAVLAGLNFILGAQYPSGGWPHSYPVRDDYTRYATYNDDMMPDLMTLLREVFTSADFDLVGADNKKRARDAYDRGIGFVLKSQIRVNDKLTAWPQQADQITYEPRPARAFEPVAISGGESASVLSMLMDIPKPSPEVIASVEAGVQWYRDNQINGIRVETIPGAAPDRVVLADVKAPPLWARFYQIETGKPIFVGRDAIIRFAMAEIEQERRAGYSWYSTSGAAVFKRYAEWKNERRWDAQPATNVDEAAAGAYTLPDLLKTISGEAVKTVADWEQKRRPEIMKLLADYQEGATPDRSIRTSVDVVERDAIAMDGAAKRTQVRIGFPGKPDAPKIRVMLHTPANAKGPVPTLLYLSFIPNIMITDAAGVDEGMAWSAALKAPVPDREATRVGPFDAKAFVDRGYGIATVYYGDIYPDFDHGNAYGVPALFGPKPDKRAPGEWGAIGAWAWGLSRVMDYLQAEPSVRRDEVALAGVSRLGKATLWAAAQDQRFAAVIPWLSGEGGAAISRRNYGETVADLTNPSRYDYWFAPRYQDYAFRVEDLPVDGHFLLAMTAPRPVLQIVGTEDTWSDPMGEWVSAQAAESVWGLYGKSLAAKTYPKPDKPALGDMSFLLHDGRHTTLPIDFVTIADFLDLHFGKPQR